jgi:hypothetical protein
MIILLIHRGYISSNLKDSVYPLEVVLSILNHSLLKKILQHIVPGQNSIIFFEKNRLDAFYFDNLNN